MISGNSIEIISCKLNTDILPQTLYQNTTKRWSEKALVLDAEIIEELQQVLQEYLRVMGLPDTLYPARLDLGISQEGRYILYEITTGFVDQIGSCLALQESIGEKEATEILSQTPFDGTVLSTTEYRAEYDLMRQYFLKSGKNIAENGGETIFLYGYPIDTSLFPESLLIPGLRGLSAEQKLTQAKVLQRILLSPKRLVLPRIFSCENTPYSELPDEKNTKLVFKQDLPKVKGNRNTISFGKGSMVRERYESGKMLAQEYIPPFRDSEGMRPEIKALFLPTASGSTFLGAYTLWDENPTSSNFGNTCIPNDGFPQGPVLVS